MASNVRENFLSLNCGVEFVTGNTSTKIRLVDKKSKHHIARIDHDKISSPVNYSEQEIEEFNNKFDCIVFSDYNKGVVSYDLIIKCRKNFKGPIFIDSKKNDLSKFEGCVVKINENEYNNRTSNCSSLVVTLGERGAMCNGVIYSSENHVDIVDVCGAGDTFLAALVYEFLKTKSIDKSVRFANIASSITVTKFGVYAPTFDEIKARYEQSKKQ